MDILKKMRFLDSIFKPAKSDNKSWNLLKTLFQTSIFWISFLVIIPKVIQMLESIYDIPSFESWNFVGWILFILFSILGLFSGYTMSWFGAGTPLPMDCPKELVVRGPYRFIRNPLAVAGIGQGICVGFIMGSHGVIVYAVFGAILWHFLVRPAEEKDLEERFGETYLEYKRQVSCWIPRIH